mgnify:CR=1 FL=1
MALHRIVVSRLRDELAGISNPTKLQLLSSAKTPANNVNFLSTFRQPHLVLVMETSEVQSASGMLIASLLLIFM